MPIEPNQLPDEVLQKMRENIDFYFGNPQEPIVLIQKTSSEQWAEKGAQIAHEYHQKKSEWVKVADMLPDDKQIVQIFCRNRTRGYAIYYETDQWDRKHMFVLNGGFLDTDFVTHWMPLPAPPTNK